MSAKRSQEKEAVFGKGAQPFRARARIMLLLGEQLIRDEVSAVFELIKNSYDADASHVTVTLENVSVKDGARITVLDNGHGMTREKLLSSWLEIGTLAKSEGGIRKSPKGRRYLGEKGIGRLAVHKLGWRTELTTRAEGSRSETDLAIDWTEFEKRRQDFLENLSVEWNEHSPKVFPGETKYEQGTRIIITKLQQRWTSRMIEKLSLNVESLTSPFVELRSFSVDLKVNDPVQPTPSKGKVQSALSTAPYVFDAEVDEFGRVKGLYQFKRPDLPKNLLRTWPIDYSILDPNEFPLDPQTGKQKPPVCGPFKFRLFAWDLTREDKEAIFGGARTYEDIIRPNAGVRVFRDGFRVLPYGNPDDDWLGLDSRRITGTFETKISRNQIIGIVDISSNENSLLRDKSDREGLIDNEAFKDFRSRILTAINLFETQRGHDRAVMKKQLGRTRKDKLAKIQATLSQIEEILVSSKGMSAGESLHQVQGLLAKLKTDVVEVVEESEEPLLVAAAMGIAYMIPTHEAVRDLQRIKRILQTTTSGMPDSKTKSELQKAWRFAFRADEIVSGTAKIFKRGKYKDIELDSIARQAYDLMRDRLEEDSVKTQVLTKRISIHGSEKFLLVVLLNLLDNADYWLATIDANKRRINIIVDKLADGLPVLIVSDSGPGLPDDIEYLAEPFVTNKPDGMGLGLYIANEIAIAHHGRLRSFSQGEVAGLLSGASVGIVFPERGVENGSN